MRVRTRNSFFRSRKWPAYRHSQLRRESFECPIPNEPSYACRMLHGGRLLGALYSVAFRVSCALRAGEDRRFRDKMVGDDNITEITGRNAAAWA